MILVLPAFSFAQETKKLKVLTKEIEVKVENDVFTSIFRDQYYSSGAFGSFRYLLDSSKYPARVISSSLKFEMIQRMYTSSLIEEDKIEDIDRPYAGMFSLAAHKDFFLDNGQFLGLSFELGWMGPASQTDGFHIAWHGFFGLPDPNGWFAQVNDGPILNGYINHGLALLSTTKGEVNGDIFLESNAAFGTVFNSIRESLVFRFGKINPIQLSGFFGNTLGLIKPPKKTKIALEAYIFYSPGIQHIIYDGTLQGGLLSRTSDFTKSPRPWRTHHRFGLQLRYDVFDFNFNVYVHTKEANGLRNHHYAGIELKRRF